MKKISSQHSIVLTLTGVLCTAAILLAANYNLLPFTLENPFITPSAPVHLTTVLPGTITKPIQITRKGSIENSKSVPINAEFSGHLSELYVTEGQTVKVGQPLLKLQPSVESQPAPKVETSQQFQTVYDHALQEFNRYQKLFDLGAIPRRQLDIATARLQEAKEALALSNVQTTQSSAIRSGPSTMTAPIDGIVTGLFSSSEKMVQAGQQLLSLGSGQEVEVVVHLDQNDLYLVHLGTPAAIEVSQQTIIGQVARIYPQVEADQIPFFLAYIKLTNNPDNILKPGMSVNLHIDTDKSTQLPIVPATAVHQDNQGRKFIYLAVNNKAVIQQIDIGETIGEFTEITSTLPQESLIITSNVNHIKNGDVITITQ